MEATKALRALKTVGTLLQAKQPWSAMAGEQMVRTRLEERLEVGTMVDAPRDA